MSKRFEKEDIKRVMEHFGFKMCGPAKEPYFLQVKQQFKPMTKRSMKELDVIFNGVPEKKVEKPKTAKSKKGVEE